MLYTLNIDHIILFCDKKTKSRSLLVETKTDLFIQ